MFSSPIAVKSSAGPKSSTAAEQQPARAKLEDAQYPKAQINAPARRSAAAGDSFGSETPTKRPEDIPIFSPGERPEIHAPHIVQPKLRVGETNSPLEHEADRVASEVMQTPASRASIRPTTPQISLKPLMPNHAGAESRPSSAQDSNRGTPELVQQVLRGPGQPMDAETKAFMEPRFGQQFGHIRIHTDSLAAHSARQLNARAYTAGNNIVFAQGEFAPHSAGGRSLLAHELTHAVQQGGQPQLIQRAPAHYGTSTAQVGPQPGPEVKKQKQPMSVDDIMGFLVTFRDSSREEFLQFLGKNEGVFYPVLKRFGFQGSWVKSEDYLQDFDAAVAKWGKAYLYRQNAGRGGPPPKPKTPEERRYENAILIRNGLDRPNPYNRSDINDQLESAGLMEDLKSHGFEYESRWSHVDPYYYAIRAVKALNGFILPYQEDHNIRVQRPSGKITDGKEIDIANARAEGLETMEGSFLGSVAGGFAMQFTDDPRIIAGVAGIGAAVEGSLGAVATAVGGKGSYRPDVENKPAEAYTNDRDRISDPVDPSKVGTAPDRDPLPTPDHPDAAKTGGHSDPPPRPAPDPYEKMSPKELRKLARTDREAAEALRLRYRSMSDAELARRAKSGDAMAKSVRDQRVPTNTPVRNLPRQGEARFSDQDVFDDLQRGIKMSRKTSGIRRSGPHVVTPDATVQGGVAGAAKTNVPGLENRLFIGNSPVAGGQVNHDSEFKPATDYDTLPHTHGHAEQDLADQIDEAFKGIPPETLKGKKVWMLIEQIPCSTCSAGIGTSDPAVEAGVLAKLSQKYPTVTFEVKHLDGSGNKLTLNQGKDTVVPLRPPAKPKVPDGTSKP